MTQAKVKTKVIKEAIERTEAEFDTSADGLISLSTAQVKDEIINLMQRKQAEKERKGLISQDIAGVPAVRPGGPRAEWTYKDNYFTVTLNKCRYSSRNSVVCDFNVLNKDKEDRDFRISGYSFGVTISKLYDNLGNTIDCNSAEVANSGRREVASSLVVSRRSIPAALYCQSGDTKASSIAKLSVAMCSDGDCRSVDYREIPIESESHEDPY